MASRFCPSRPNGQPSSRQLIRVSHELELELLLEDSQEAAGIQDAARHQHRGSSELHEEMPESCALWGQPRGAACEVSGTEYEVGMRPPGAERGLPRGRNACGNVGKRMKSHV